MHKIREICRLILQSGLSNRKIGQSINASHNTVGRYRKRLGKQPLTVEVLASLDDTALLRIIKATNAHQIPQANYLPIDWEHVHAELQTKGVTMQLLWEEYKLAGLTELSYSHFARLHRTWAKKLDVTMRQAHRAGEKMFVDFSGKTVPIHLADGDILNAQIFVAVLGASGYTYVEAVRSQTIRDWLVAHVNALAYFGGVPLIIVPDNLKAAVIRYGKKGFKLNSSYLDFARHYQTAVIPARPGKPKDKAKVEGAVLLVQRWILARLRHHTFFSLDELNAHVRELLTDYNRREYKKRTGSRYSLFKDVDSPALNPLPADNYQFSEWRIGVQVGRNCHVEHEKHYYSVPREFVGRRLDINAGLRTVEFFYKHQRVASHARSLEQGGYTTVTAHLPKSYQKYSEWNPRRLLIWAHSIGQSTEQVFDTLLNQDRRDSGLRSCVALVQEAKDHGYVRFEMACERALAIQSPTLSSIRSILRRKLDRVMPDEQPHSHKLPEHANVRGADYFSQVGGVEC